MQQDQKDEKESVTKPLPSDDSDCEIQEPNISVIELNDSADESESAVAPAAIDNEAHFLENSPKKQPESEILFTVSFDEREKYDCLREFIQDAVKKCLDERSCFIQIVEDESTLSFHAIEQLGPEKMTDLIFSIDTTPSGKPEISSIPSYKRSVREIFNDQKTEPATETDECARRPRISNVCFNCAGDHSLKDCTEPKNQQRINKARKSFGTKHERYHIDIEQRFAHLRPGQITGGLRKALGLRIRELPPFIYKMRMLGYPPGWLEDAKVAHSGLTLFDSEGRQVHGSDDEGELEESKHKYDVRKIISFPGFNCQPDPDYIEDRGMPPMQNEDQKDVFIKSLGGNIVKGYKRKKLKNYTATEPDKQIAIETADMDIDNDEEISPIYHHHIPIIPLPPPLPDDNTQPPPPPPEVPSIVTELCNRKRRKSPTLEDLEAKQRQIMEALQNSTSLLDGTTDDSLIDEILEVQNMVDSERIESPITVNGDTTQTKIISIASNATSPITPAQRNLMNKRLSVLGTPVLKFSPYNQLPTGDQFSKGVCDVINFENLPDSTGKYEKMTLVIKKVRKAVKSNDEN